MASLGVLSEKDPDYWISLQMESQKRSPEIKLDSTLPADHTPQLRLPRAAGLKSWVGSPHRLHVATSTHRVPPKKEEAEGLRGCGMGLRPCLGYWEPSLLPNSWPWN